MLFERAELKLRRIGEKMSSLDMSANEYKAQVKHLEKKMDKEELN